MNTQEAPRPPLLVLTGPTGVGKTALSLEVAGAYRGEIVSADSRQIYRGMDIGTGKATPEEQSAAPHHLLDIRNPDNTLSLAEYQELATATIHAIHARGALPMLVGGTGLYVKAVIEGMRIPNVPPNPALREELEATLATEGIAPLVARLTVLDPTAETTVDLRNPRRVIRALEIVLLTGVPKSQLEGSVPPLWRILALCLTRPRADLYRRIDARVDGMIADGLVEETRRLYAQYDPALPALSSLGYREIGAYLRGEMPLASAIERIKLETHRYVRQQETFFRKISALQWLEVDAAPEERIHDWFTDVN